MNVCAADRDCHFAPASKYGAVGRGAQSRRGSLDCIDKVGANRVGGFKSIEMKATQEVIIDSEELQVEFRHNKR